MQFLLGKNCIDEESILGSSPNAEVRRQQEKIEMTARQVAFSRQSALKQRDVMEKQSNRIAKRESERGGLVIVKAIYGVMDSATNEWVARRNVSNGMPKLYALDATTQLQFWVNDGSLHMPATSKKNMLGFYDIMASVSNEDWLPQTHAQPLVSTKNFDSAQQENIFKKLSHWCKQRWKKPRDTKEIIAITRTRRDLKVVLSVQYKFGDELNEVSFLDNEAVELPQQKGY